MPLGPQIISYGNIQSSWIVQIALTPSICAANTTTVQTFAFPGLLTIDEILASKAAYQAGLIIAGANCFTSGILSLQFGNLTASGITPTAGELYTFYVTRLLAGMTMSGIQ